MKTYNANLAQDIEKIAGIRNGLRLETRLPFIGSDCYIENKCNIVKKYHENDPHKYGDTLSVRVVIKIPMFSEVLHSGTAIKGNTYNLELYVYQGGIANAIHVRLYDVDSLVSFIEKSNFDEIFAVEHNKFGWGHGILINGKMYIFPNQNKGLHPDHEELYNSRSNNFNRSGCMQCYEKDYKIIGKLKNSFEK